MTHSIARTWAAAALVLTIVAVPYVVAQSKVPVINVTVQYTGKARVTDKTPIWVYLFNTPNANAQTPPLAVKRLAKNGGAVQFEYAGTAPAYVFVSLDLKGGYDPTTGPPEAGSPIGNYSTDAKTAAAVKVTPVTNIKITFNDSVVFKP